MFALLIISFASVNAEILGPFTQHFFHFLKEKNNDYALSSVLQHGDTGSFGGKVSENEEIHMQPVVFIHGNSDSALNAGKEHNSGWNRNIRYFLERGYTMSELYGLTYGDRNLDNSYHRRHNCHDLMGLRTFLENVLEYTGVKKIDIVAHSMGVTYARRIIRGGMVILNNEMCYLGESIADRIDSFIAISGANYGMCACHGYQDMFKACGAIDGFFAGYSCLSDETTVCNATRAKLCDKVSDYSSFLKQMNNDKEKEADYIFSLWSLDDPIIGLENMVWGRPTSMVPGSNMFKAYKKLNHFEMKWETLRDQFNALTRHSL